MKPIPFFYFPTTLHLVDDHPRFPHSINNYLTESSRSVFYTRPTEFIESVNQLASQNSTFISLLEALKENLFYGKSQFLLETLEDYLNQPSRFTESAVVTIDYSMPQVNGLETAIALPTHLKKILLTGEADYTIALTAFNEGIIDRFIRKDADSLPQHIATAILELGLDYFSDLTHNILNDPQIKPYIPAYLISLDFKKFFIDLWRQHNGVEFYLLHPAGDFLCFTAEGVPFQLSFRDEAGLKQVIEALEQAHIDEPTEQSEAALANVRAKQSLLVFPLNENETSISTEKWQNYLYALQHTSIKNQVLYYAYVPINSSLFKNIFSLMQYQL